ncbi:MAG: histidinol-phosphatase HisJ family protein, partial [Ruminococcaceae bacterium]|nr:histidinol-phosphatase HisJ family protein [Oscillospiraceae bacterium]
MYIHDSHVHTLHSFDGARDGSGEVSAVIDAAIAAGVNELSLCDHCDIDDVLDGIYPPFDAEAIRDDILSTREKYAGKIRVNFGVELGQAHARREEANALLDRMGYDFVIGSLHNLRAYPDFSLIKYDHMDVRQIHYLMRRMLSETMELIDFGRFSTLAHITYIQRYLTIHGRDFPWREYRDEFEKLFRAVIDKGLSLECNTSGLRRNSITMPGYDLLAMYRECGGERITLGSDAHTARDVGKGIEEAAAELRRLGF